ncbi:MAG: type VI secretion system lipoprotein TssJ [Proteobacteria bacterium]|nr:type VI secretion system lipoprotein TssJ [Pseudomonadota bacterium]
MRRRAGALALPVLLVFAWLLGPCALAQNTTVELTIVGGPGVNPNSQGRASPVVVRIFDLTSTAAFDGADYQNLFEHPGDALKHDIASQEELVVRAGEINQRNHSLPPAVVAIGIAAAFRNLEQATWRVSIPVKVGRLNFLLIDLDQDKIRVEALDSEPAR